MPCVFDYLDYRSFLHDFYEHTKKDKPYFSYRYISGRVGINPGYVVKVFQGKVHLGVNNIELFADLLKLEGKEREFFTELVHFGRAKTKRDIEMRFERLKALKGIRFRTVADDQAEFYQQWYHMAMRTLLYIYPFDGHDYRRLGAQLIPKVSAAQARESVHLLERMQLVERDKGGIYRVTDQFISTGEKWIDGQIRKYQKATIELAGEALEKIDNVLRDISTVTMTFSRRDLPALRERVSQFRRELLQMAQDCTDQDAVMQLNVQVFPVAIVDKGNNS